MTATFPLLLGLMLASSALPGGRDWHVAPDGSDQARGTAAAPLRTVSAAAALAQPGDTVTVHGGVYRERITPPRGGTSDEQRIVYRAAPGEDVTIKGSEPVTGWTRVRNDAWEATVPNALFGDFNPYADAIAGDWFDPRGRVHHTGAVYLNGHWLTEAIELDHVLEPAGTVPRYSPGTSEYLLNVAWIQALSAGAEPGRRTPAVSFADHHGIQTAACSEGGECIGWINHGDWVVYRDFTLGPEVDRLEIRAASASQGGVIEIRQGTPEGAVLGSCNVPNTGDWQTWKSFTVPLEGGERGTQPLCLFFRAAQDETRSQVTLWFAEVGETETTIWAQFPGLDPNREDVEINVRQAVFYPAEPGVDYLTVRGFRLMHAATPWAPPTAEQVGLIGTHWSKGWIIEDNEIAYSTCVGVTLGKHGDEFDNTSANSAEGYVKTIERAHAFALPWTRENIGHHVVRNNRISHCEQAGIVGSLGAVFSTVSGNVIHDIHVRRLFSGAEMAGIKLHAAIDTEISGNQIHDTCLGIWLDWMAQGTRVTRNLLYDNGMDLFMEVNHGPYTIDHNLFLSPASLLDVSEGGAFAHNLFAGSLRPHPEPNRDTPFHRAHSTEVAGLSDTRGGDNRFYNNLFTGGTGLAPYSNAARPCYTAGNVFLGSAQPATGEENPLLLPGHDAGVSLESVASRIVLRLELAPAVLEAATRPVTTERLGRAAVPDLPYVNPDGAPLSLDTDYRGRRRQSRNPTPGPFERPGTGALVLGVWD
jgi:hypothetical protein